MKGRIILYGVIAGLLGCVMVACHKFPVPPVVGSVNFKIQYKVDGEQLTFDTIRYLNSAGNAYSVTKLEYYISDLTLIRGNGTVYSSKDIHYLNARSTNKFTLADIPPGNYVGMSFHIGLNVDTNKTGKLPGKTENLNMAWPEPMGGGYHFLKFEGHFKDSTGATLGYAMHVGTDICLMKVTIDHPFDIRYLNQAQVMTMNVNQWFTDPVTYDLSTANYIMGDPDNMLKIAGNGVNVFSMD